MGRITTNASDFRNELIKCLEHVPGNHEPILVFTQVHLLLLTVRAIFVVPDGHKMRLVKRTWLPPKQAPQHNAPTLYFLDEIVMQDQTRILERMQSEMIFEYMSFPLKRPKPIEGILLDGSTYKIRFNTGKKFTWHLEEQLTGSLKKLVEWIEML
jgi:hypothetical protein